MPLYIGGKRVENLYVGGQRIERAYLGSTLVYQPDAGFLDEFNRTDLGPNWKVEGAPVTVTPGQACSVDLTYMWWSRQYPEDDVRVSVTVDDIPSWIQILTNADTSDISTASSYMITAWGQDGTLISAAFRLGQSVLYEEVTVKKPEPGDVLTLQRNGHTVHVMINGVLVADGSPNPPLPEGEGHRHIGIVFTGCITRFEATDVGPVVPPRREVQHFTSSGSLTTDLPEWTRHVRALAWGGGGGGHGGDGAIVRNGRGGSAGTAAIVNLTSPGIPLTNFPITVGAGGAGGAKEKSGGDGGSTSPGGADPVPGGAGGSTYSSSSGGNAGDLTLRDETVVSGGGGGSTNDDGSAPGGGGGGGAGGLFGSARSGGRGGDGRVTLDIVDQAWIDAFGTGE